MSSDYEPPILYARDEKGRYRFIDDVANGDACGCFCPACDQPMRARNAGMKLRHSFAHQPGMTCTWAVEAVITMLAKQAIEESGRMALPALYYENAVSGKMERLSQSQIMRIAQVETIDVAGRQAPCLVVVVQGGGKTARFGLCVTLRRRLTFEQEQSLLADTRGIVLVDLGIDLARQRAEQGKHYDRDELVKSYQDKDFLAGILLDKSSELMSWECNASRDEREAKSAAELEEQEDHHEADKSADQEARGGIVRKPDRFVTEYDEYDVRRWGTRRLLDPRAKLAPNERYVVNGALEALIVEEDKGSSLTLRCEMDLDAINEVSWTAEELSQGFDRFVLALDAGYLTKSGQITLAEGKNGEGVLSMRAYAHDYCCALQGLVSRGIRVVMFGLGRRGRTVRRVDVNAKKVFLA
ncbi:MAG: hypothetical protein Q4B54_10345 [Coriobacteriales bacterium]|nr:hypothetical protein [Coriobacteriales bacterium]